DSRYDREAARAAGARFIGLGIDGDERLERLGDLVC
ncbi:MAG: haloacid dehalogenase, partial [Myxococcaceae bacterium]|nr:haloacid dehalogenase [Myxococcaceae bacterium]